MKIKITIIALLLSIISFAQDAEPKYKVSTGSVKKKQSKADPNKVYSEVEQAPEFPGGIAAFRNKFAENLDISKIEGSGILSSELSFVIEKDGAMSELKASGSNEEFNSAAVDAFKSIKEKWKPGKMDGEFVRSIFRMPLKMAFENDEKESLPATKVSDSE
ncbi:hypothetical protein [Chryseobacterium sp. RLHN22]|uniref:hypothetical protein n=1 Tax=Chryseobacterium sp. RLHN22 TaxID=3437885 RepID=UPI003D9ADBEF